MAKGQRDHQRARTGSANALTPVDKRVIEHFLRHGNKTEALRSEGLPHANAQCTRYFKKKSVLAEIERRRAELEKKDERLTDEKIINEIALIGFARMGELLEEDGAGNVYLDLKKLTPEQKAVITEFTVEEYMEGYGDDGERVKKTRFKFASKMDALVTLAKIKGLFSDAAQVNIGQQVINKLNEGRARFAKPPVDVEYEEVEDGENE